MLPYTWAVGLGKIKGVPAGGSQLLGLGGTPEEKHETCQ